MVNITLLWLLVVPLVLSFASFWLLPKLDKSIDLKRAGIFSLIGLAISCFIMAMCFMIGKGSKTSDTELWNGQITSKERIHDSYVQSYQCNCVTTTDSRGNSSTTCQTCYEDHYTVTWKAHSNIGDFTIKHLDETSKRVYMTPDPRFYTRVREGEPCSVEHTYKNYIKAVPNTLFRPAGAALKAQFANMIPSYPNGLYDMWKVDRVLPVKVKVPDIAEWNSKLSESLKTLGPSKQANAIIILVNTQDPNYAYALQDAWLNGKKNDIILIIGTSDISGKADWVSVLAMTDNEMFKIRLRDDILDLDSLSADNVIGTLRKDTLELFKRKPMADFAYLDAEIDPPFWLNVTMVVLTILAYVGFWVFVYYKSHKQFSRRNSFGYNSYRRNRF